MVRKLNKAKKPEGSLVSRQKAKLEDQRRKKRIDTERARKTTNAEKYEQEKSAREAKGGKGYGGGYPGYLMGGSQSSSNFNPRTVREQIISHLLDEGFASDERSAESIMGAMSEAWVESIFEEFKDLTPEKESRVKNRVGELARDMEVSNARMNELKKKPLGKYRPKIKAEKEEIVSSARRKHNLIKNATDALIRTKVGRQASITKKIYDTKKKLKELGED